jgi:hypothetical protein
MNSGTVAAQGMTVELVQTGFNVVRDALWPSKLLPGSSIHGSYVLQAVQPGNQTIYLVATFLWNSTYQGQPLARNVSVDSRVIFVEVSSVPTLSLSQTSIGALIGAASAIVVVLIGTFLPVARDHFTKASEARRQSRKDKLNLKSQILFELNTDEGRLQELQYVLLKGQDLLAQNFALFGPNSSLGKMLANLYNHMSEYNTLIARGEDAKTKALAVIAEIKAARKSLEDWMVD